MTNSKNNNQRAPDMEKGRQYNFSIVNDSDIYTKLPISKPTPEHLVQFGFGSPVAVTGLIDESACEETAGFMPRSGFAGPALFSDALLGPVLPSDQGCVEAVGDALFLVVGFCRRRTGRGGWCARSTRRRRARDVIGRWAVSSQQPALEGEPPITPR